MHSTLAGADLKIEFLFELTVAIMTALLAIEEELELSLITHDILACKTKELTL